MVVVRPTQQNRDRWDGGFTGEGPEKSTFGEPMSAGSDMQFLDELDVAVEAAQSFGSFDRDTTEVFKLDGEIAESQRRRWRLVEGGVFVTEAPEYVPGDVASIRYDLMTSTVPTQDPEPNEQYEILKKDRASKLIRLLAGATPYFLPHGMAWEVMASDIADEDRSDLLLSAPSLVLFSSGLGVPTEYLGVDPHVLKRIEYSSDLVRLDPNGPSEDRHDYGPLHLRATSLALLQSHDRMRTGETDQAFLPFQVLGALLLPDTDGTLLDAMCWVVRAINPDLSEQEIVSNSKAAITTGTHPYSLIPGLRSNSTIASVAEALAAVVAWGRWSNPGAPVEKLPQRKERRTKDYQRTHEQGGYLGVHTVDVKPPEPAAETEAKPSRSVRSHYRRGYWRRSRVGPRNDWHYERRHIAPTIVNPSADPIERALTIYRLPLPSRRTDHNEA